MFILGGVLGWVFFVVVVLLVRCCCFCLFEVFLGCFFGLFVSWWGGSVLIECITSCIWTIQLCACPIYVSPHRSVSVIYI